MARDMLVASSGSGSSEDTAALRLRDAASSSSSGSCCSSSAYGTSTAGPLHLRRTSRTRRRGSLLLTAAAAASSVAFNGMSVAAYAPVQSASAISPTGLSARDLLETALTLRENRRRRQQQQPQHVSSSEKVDVPDLDRLHSQIFGPSSSSSSASGGISTSSYSWTEALFDEPETLSMADLDAVDVVGSSARRMESRIMEERSDLNNIKASVSSDVNVDADAVDKEDIVALRLQEEAAERRRRMTTTDMAASKVKPAFVVDNTNKSSKKSLAAGSQNKQVTKITQSTGSDSKADATIKAKAKVKMASSSKISSTASSKPTNTNANARKSASSKNSRKRQQQPLSPITERHDRITAEEELELARTIQRGSELHNLKSTFESEHGRDITRQEWTDLAMQAQHLNLPIQNPRDLRRLVSAYRSAKNQLVASNMGLVYAVVRSKHGHRLRMAGVSEDELVQEGSLGLIRAAELFDPERGLRFSTYATVWIKGMLSNCQLDQTIALPAREKTKWNKIRRAAADLVLEKGDDDDEVHLHSKPKLGDVATRTGLDAAAVERTTSKMSQVQKVLSLDYQYKTARRSDVEEHIGFEHDRAFQVDADLAERLNFKSDVIAALARNLSEEEAQLMRLRYGLDAEGSGEGRSLADCAKIMGWSRDKARLLANKCLKKLREADEAEALQEYLLTVA